MAHIGSLSPTFHPTTATSPAATPAATPSTEELRTAENSQHGDNKNKRKGSPLFSPRRPAWAARAPDQAAASTSSTDPNLFHDMSFWMNKLPDEETVKQAWNQLPRLADKRAMIEFAEKTIQPKLDALLSQEEGPIVIHIGEIHGQASTIEMQEWVLSHVASKEIENGKHRNLIYLNEVPPRHIEIAKYCEEMHLKNRAELRSRIPHPANDEATLVTAIRLARIKGFKVSSLEPTLPAGLDQSDFSSLQKFNTAREETMLRMLKSALSDKNALIVSVGGVMHLPRLHWELRGNQTIAITLLQKTMLEKKQGLMISSINIITPS